MHAGMANNGNGRRAHGAKFSAASAKTIMPAGIQNEKCTPVRRSNDSDQRAHGDKFPRRHSRNDHAGGDTE
ncbi:MAG: hypothetical protein ACLR23_27790 [Clostridia bacterium]